MATENYGVFASIVSSTASTAVGTGTTLVAIGSCSGGDLNKAYYISSFADYTTQLGGARDDGYSLTDACIAAFEVAGLNKIVLIPVSHSKEFVKSDYMGDAALETGIYSLAGLLREAPTTTNLVFMPGVTDADVLAALNGICTLTDGHWQSFMVYDLPETGSQINTSNIAIPSTIIQSKILSSERARAVWGRCRIGTDTTVSGAAVQACLMALADAEYNAPARCGGNLHVPIIASPCVEYDENVTVGASGSIDGDAHPKITMTADGYTDYTGPAHVAFVVTANGESVDTVDADVSFSNGAYVSDIDTTGYTAPVAVDSVAVSVSEHRKKDIKIPQSIGNQLSADGVCSWISYGGGMWYTWGDHTSAFSAGTITDERGRFDNTIRMLMMITNRFQIKYRFSVDDPMTLQMRNDIIDEELTYLNILVSIGALIGEPVVEFTAIDNTEDTIQRGEFTFRISTTPTIPAKYIDAKINYTTAGLSVYTAQ